MEDERMVEENKNVGREGNGDDDSNDNQQNKAKGIFMPEKFMPIRKISDDHEKTRAFGNTNIVDNQGEESFAGGGDGGAVVEEPIATKLGKKRGKVTRRGALAASLSLEAECHPSLFGYCLPNSVDASLTVRSRSLGAGQVSQVGMLCLQMREDHLAVDCLEEENGGLA
ncbi:hypothetical protein Ancab_027774 [Ancistrocladus abbreviatus]